MPAVIVEWGDAHADAEFHDDDSLPKQHESKLVKSIGWIWERDDKGITLVSCVSNEDYDRRIFIPAGMVRRVRRLQAKR